MIFWAFFDRWAELHVKRKKVLKTCFAKGVFLDPFLGPKRGHFWGQILGPKRGHFGPPNVGFSDKYWVFGPAEKVLKKGCVLGPKKGPKKGPKVVTGKKRTIGGCMSSSVHTDTTPGSLARGSGPNPRCDDVLEQRGATPRVWTNGGPNRF